MIGKRRTQRFRTERIRRASPERMQLFNQFSPDTLRANTFFTLCFLCICVEECILRRIRSGPPDTLERMRPIIFLIPERIQRPSFDRIRSGFDRIRSGSAGYVRVLAGYAQGERIQRPAGYAQLRFFLKFYIFSGYLMFFFKG